jgi:hypothetical protein
MNHLGPKLLLASLLWLAASCSSLRQSIEEGVTAYVAMDMPTVIAFLPPSIQHSRDKEAAAAQAHVTSAIEDAKSCLGENYASYRVLVAERIVVRSPGREESFELGRLTPLVGALLLRPGSNSRILFAGGGPEALVRMLRPAASEYFGKQCEG